MDKDILDLLGFFLPFLTFVGIFIAIILFTRGRQFSLEYDPLKGLFILKNKSKTVYELSRADIEEFILDSYVVKSKNNSRTYFTVGIKLNPNTLSRVILAYPKFNDCAKDGEGYRIFTSPTSSKARSLGEEYSKKSGVPLRSLSGELRQSTELDIPFHEIMKNKIDLINFPPHYRQGDSFEIKMERDGISLIPHKKIYGMTILLAFIGFVVSIVYFFMWSDSFFSFNDSVDLWIAGIVHLPVLLLAFFTIRSYLKTKSFTVRVSGGILYWNKKKIPLSGLEEVFFKNFNIYFVTNNSDFSYNIAMFIYPNQLEEFVLLVQKMIVYQGLR